MTRYSKLFCSVLSLRRLMAVLILGSILGLMMPPHSAASEMLPQSLIECSGDQQCELYQDGCYSCGELLAVRVGMQDPTRAYLVDRARERGEGIRACEACAIDMARVQVVCVSGRCSARRVSVDAASGIGRAD